MKREKCFLLVLIAQIDSSIRLFADDCIIYRKITNKNDIENLQKDLDTLGERAVKYGVKINVKRKVTT